MNQFGFHVLAPCQPVRKLLAYGMRHLDWLSVLATLSLTSGLQPAGSRP